jgi:hypothetical protein
LTLTIHPDEIPNELLRDFVGTRYGVAMVRIEDDETAKVYDNRVKTAGKLCRSKEFHGYVGVVLGLNIVTEETAIQYIYDRCGIESRTELNGNTEAQTQFDEMMEEYEKMPQYGSREGFIEKFFRPVAQSAWKNLSSKGYMALNMPKEMYEAIKKDLPPIFKKMYLPVTTRHPTNAVSGRKIGEQDSAERTEIIYVWKKGGLKTRKNKINK